MKVVSLEAKNVLLDTSDKLTLKSSQVASSDAINLTPDITTFIHSIQLFCKIVDKMLVPHVRTIAGLPPLT